MIPAASSGAPSSEDTKVEGMTQAVTLPEPPSQHGNSPLKASEADVKMEER